MKTHLDHLVIGASTLEKGIRYVTEQLGVEIPLGGRHAKMGTHNCLTKLGDSMFLEVIAIDPKGTRPLRPRWFGLDDSLVQRSLAEQPQLLTWVVNTDNIETILTRSEMSFGTAESISRGELNWYFGIPDDGRLLAGGMLPYIISWQVEEHPAKKMADTGCRLIGLKLYTPITEWICKQLVSIGASSLIDVIKLPPNALPYLQAEIKTPLGVKILSSAGSLHCS